MLRRQLIVLRRKVKVRTQLAIARAVHNSDCYGVRNWRLRHGTRAGCISASMEGSSSLFPTPTWSHLLLSIIRRDRHQAEKLVGCCHWPGTTVTLLIPSRPATLRPRNWATSSSRSSRRLWTNAQVGGAAPPTDEPTRRGAGRVRGRGAAVCQPLLIWQLGRLRLAIEVHRRANARLVQVTLESCNPPNEPLDTMATTNIEAASHTNSRLPEGLMGH